MTADDTVERVLVVSAHPDDVDFGAAGSVASWTDSGVDVTYCIVTDGAAGGFDPNVSRIEMAEIRQVEQTAAAKAVGVDDVVFLGYPDGRLEVSFDLRRDLSRVIRQTRPQRVVAQSPDRIYERIFASHPDHLAAGEAALSAVYPRRQEPVRAPRAARRRGSRAVVRGGGVADGRADQPNRFVDVTETFERKLDALRCHVSQHRQPEQLEPMLRGDGSPATPNSLAGPRVASPRASTPSRPAEAGSASLDDAADDLAGLHGLERVIDASRGIRRETMSPRSSLPCSTSPISRGKSRLTCADP